MFNFLAVNQEALSKSLTILWKGLLAVVVVISVTYLMQSISEKSEKKNKNEEKTDE